VESTSQFEIKTIPQEGAGMYVKTVRGEWYVQPVPSLRMYKTKLLHQGFNDRSRRTSSATVSAQSDIRSDHPMHFRIQVRQLQSNLFQHIYIINRSARLQLIDRAPGVSTNISLFPSPSVNPQKCIASSGPYSDAISGVDISRQLIAAGKYYLVPSTYHAGVFAQFRLIIYSTNSGIAVTLRS
jgi:calpain-7